MMSKNIQKISCYLQKISMEYPTTQLAVCIALIANACVAHAATLRLGELRVAQDNQYIVPVTLTVDGYSTFRARVMGDSRFLAALEWKSIERAPGALIVIQPKTPLTAPKKITLAVQYQGRERVGEYLLEPTTKGKTQKGKKQTVALAVPAEIPARAPKILRKEKAEEGKNEPAIAQAGEWVSPGQGGRHCPVIAVQQGSLRENVARLVDECGYTFGAWHIGSGDPDWLVDWIVDTPRIIEIDNRQGAAGLLEILANHYRLRGVPAAGDPETIDFYKERGEQ